MTDIYADMANKSKENIRYRHLKWQIEHIRFIVHLNFFWIGIFLKDAGCEESTYPVQADKKKCWHFIAATRDYGFIEGAYDVLASSAQDIHIIEIALISMTSLLLL